MANERQGKMKRKHAAKPKTTRQQWTKQELEELRKIAQIGIDVSLEAIEENKQEVEHEETKSI